MIDRNVEHPSRFRLTKVEGTDDIYDLIPAPGDVVAEGDTFSKANMLPDSIPALLGLKMANPQVKDALNVLANIGNVHVWAKSIEVSETIPESYELEGEHTLNLIGPYASASGTATIGLKWTYASAVVVSNGVVSMGPDETTKELTTNQIGPPPSEIVGKFVKINGAIYYCPPTARMNTRLEGSYYTDVEGLNGVVYVPAIPAGVHTVYPTSTDSAAYPQDGDVGEYHYTYLGQLGEPGAKIVSYIGTGGYGSGSPCSVNVKNARCVIICGSQASASLFYGDVVLIKPSSFAVAKRFATSASAYTWGKALGVSWSEDVVSWYSTESAEYQMNASGRTYYAIVI